MLNTLGLDPWQRYLFPYSSEQRRTQSKRDDNFPLQKLTLKAGINKMRWFVKFFTAVSVFLLNTNMFSPNNIEFKQNNFDIHIDKNTYISSLQMSGFSIRYPPLKRPSNSLLFIVGYGVPPIETYNETSAIFSL